MTCSPYPFHVDPRNAACDKDELGIQVLFRSRMRMLAPGILLVGIPNAGRRSAWEQRQRSKEGLTPGFPDMIALHDGRSAFLEFKTGTGTLATAQIDMLNTLVRLNFVVGVFRSADTACDWLRGHFPNAFVGRLAA